ncbi:MAG: hypothetical protein ACP5OG_01895 [Candidatus Nanoarchaeia archaeon]
MSLQEVLKEIVDISIKIHTPIQTKHSEHYEPLLSSKDYSSLLKKYNNKEDRTMIENIHGSLADLSLEVSAILHKSEALERENKEYISNIKFLEEEAQRKERVITDLKKKIRQINEP